MMTSGRLVLRDALLAGVALLLLIAPSQSAFVVGGVHVTPADALLLLLVPLALATARAEGIGWRRLLSVPFSHAAFILLACFATLCSDQWKAGLGECIQFALYFLVADRVFFIAQALPLSMQRPRAGQGRHPLIAAFLAIGAVVVLIAFRQLFAPVADGAADPLQVRGTFGNRNVLGGYLSLLLPFAFGLLFAVPCRPGKRARSVLVRAALALLVLAGLCTVLSGAALLAIGLAIFTLSVCKGRLAATVTAVLFVLFLSYVAPNLPRQNLYTSLRSVELYDSETGERTRRYPEWQAAVTMAFERPWVGVGPGSYQAKIGTFYDIVPRATGPSEPDIQNLHLVLLSTCGFPAYFAFLAIFLSAIATGVSSRDPVSRAAACSLGAFLIASVWHPLLVRGIGIPMAFLLALARYPVACFDSSISREYGMIPEKNGES